MENKESHKQILKSTGIVGGSQIISIVIGIVRTKVAALLLGPSGIGIIGILQSTVDLVRSASSFGINFSAVKDIAEANNSGDQTRIDTTIIILRRWAIGTGVLGMVIAIVFCIPLSNYSFGNDTFAVSISILSITLFITSVSAGQIALLQGLRRIAQLAKATLLGSFIGMIVTLPLYFWLGKSGIVPGMILTALGALIISWLYAKRIKVNAPVISFRKTFNGGLGMAKLGFFIVVTGFIASVTMIVIRAFIVRKSNLDAVGHFHASWMISKTYIGIVLNAMLADFFPRLSAINNDDAGSNKLINEQLEMTLIVGVPMIITLCAFANLIILILYSASFHPSVALLQMNMIGSFLTLISWPLGVMFLAKGKGMYSIVNDSIWSIVFVICVYFGWDFFGFNSLGFGYLLASLVNLITVFISVKNLGGFGFSVIVKKYLIYGFLMILFLAFNILFIKGSYQYIVSLAILLTTLLFGFSKLRDIIDISSITKKFM